MPNKKPELALIKKFEEVIKSDREFGILHRVNFGLDSDKNADVEYVTTNNEYLIIEAKSHKSSNAPNTIHDLFGKLLREHGKQNPTRNNYKNNLKYCLLISGDEYNNKAGNIFYMEGFNKIPEEIYLKYVFLIKAAYVFVCFEETNTTEIYTWAAFYTGGKPLKAVKQI